MMVRPERLPCDDVARLAHLDPMAISELLGQWGMRLVEVADDAPIPGSYWGEPEAGLIANRLYARPDTPVHSILHEAAHFICMDSRRRENLHTDAGGDYDEENGVCYLQVLLSDSPGFVGRERMFADMDRWGYSFRLGSARRWFHEDAGDALAWLVRHRLTGGADKREKPGKSVLGGPAPLATRGVRGYDKARPMQSPPDRPG